MGYHKAAKKGPRGMTFVFISYKFIVKHFEEKKYVQGGVL